MGDIDTNSSNSLTETIGGTRVAKREVDTEYVFKIVVLGDYNVGKTTLIHRLLHTSLPSKHKHTHKYKDKIMKTHNKWKGKVNVAQEESSDESVNDDDDIASIDMEHISPTIGVEFFAKFILHIHPHINVRLQFWDTAGLTRYATLDNHVYRHASLILCVFDVTQKDSLKHIVSQHLVHAAEYISELEQDKIIVVGNKLDLLHDNVNAFTELLNNYHRHRRPDAAFLTSPITSSFHRSNNNVIKNNNIASMNGNIDKKKKLKSNAVTTNEVTNSDAINDAIVNDNHMNNDILYSSSDDNTSTNETTNTNTSNKNNINRTNFDNITKEQRRQAQWEAEARNSVITEKDVYECLLNDFDDIKYLTVSAHSNINMSRLLELMSDVLLCQVTDAHYERNRDERVHEHEEHEIVPVKEREECVNKEENNTNDNTREEIGTSRASGNGTYKIKDNNKEHIDLLSSSMPLNIPVVALQECDRTPHYNSYNVRCWSNNSNNNNTLSFNLSPQEQTATFVESEDNLYSPQEGNDMSMSPQHQMQPTDCEHNFSNNENNDTSMSVTISATQLIESTSKPPENVKIENVLDTHEEMDKQINCNNVKQQIVHTEINQDNIRVAEDKEKATCLHQENTINTFTNCIRDNAQVIQKAHLLESHQEPVETNLLEEQQDETEIIRPRASLLDQVAHEFEQQRQQANTASNNDSNNDECNDDGMNLQEEVRDRFTAIEAESRQRCEANKTKHCKDNNNNNSSTLTHNTIDANQNNSSPAINVSQRYKKDKKHICQCGSLPCTCM